MLAAVLVIAGVVITLAAYPYPPLPAAEVEAARAALQAARREAGTSAPRPLQQSEASAVLMERLYAYDRSRWLRFTRLEALDQAIDETRSFAARAVDEASQVRAGRLAEAEDRRRQIERELGLLGPDVKFLPPRERGVRSAIARAELALAQAKDARQQENLALLDSSLATAEGELATARRTLGKRYERFNDPEARRRWQGWVDDAVAASRGDRVSIVVHKLDRRLYLLRDGRTAVTFDADLGRNALADKVSAGDGATPEGRYRIREKRENGSTRWYKALLLDYPNAEDWKNYHALRRRGEIPAGRGPGGLIEIHGHGGKRSNWTDGCVALHNSAMDRLFAMVPVGTPVTIVGAARLPGVRAP